jgi:formylglycine-generating enzyme required for sulfatase activity
VEPQTSFSVRVKGVEYKMIYVEGGTFRMGATPEQGSDAYDDEKPVHSVTLSSYYIGQTEVTQALWKAVMGSNPSGHEGSSLYPVENVSWTDCQTFITKLNQLKGQKFRLPTEAEWEFAARGGIKSRGYQYAGGKDINIVAWYSENSWDKAYGTERCTHNVAAKQANELDLYDMSGNVWEWCQDWYGSYSRMAQSNPTGPSSGSYRVNRGGSWYDNASICRVSSREGGSTPSDRYSNVGFRLALSDEQYKKLIAE